MSLASQAPLSAARSSSRAVPAWRSGSMPSPSSRRPLFCRGSGSRRRTAGPDRAGYFRELHDGWREFTAHTWLWSSVLLFGVSNLVFVGCWAVLGPLIAKEQYGGAGAWTAILVCGGVGAVVGGVIALRYRPKRPLLASVLVAYPLMLELLALAVYAPVWLVALSAFLASAGIAVHIALWFTVFQREVPEHAQSTGELIRRTRVVRAHSARDGDRGSRRGGDRHPGDALGSVCDLVRLPALDRRPPVGTCDPGARPGTGRSVGARQARPTMAPPMSVRVRMAPSPTGFLHIGGVRTFLFNWLFARGRGGECLLRIENTDTSREVEQATEQIQRSLSWLGIEWDGPVTFQLDAMERCRELAARLVEEGKAYEDEGAIRFRMPDEGVTGWDDAVHGSIEFPNDQLEDVVIVRSDGRPTYNFASPVEDMDDAITHVIRGDDHVSNTPKQVQILRALGHEPPVYAHLPMINGPDGKKLSKRHGAVSVDEFRAAGYLPEALLNFLALLGWAPDGETTLMSRDELVERFTLERVGSSPATFDYDKLDWMNGVYLRDLSPEEYADRLVGFLREQGLDWPERPCPCRRAARAGEDRAARGVPGVRRLPLRARWSPIPGSWTRAFSRAAEKRAGARRAVVCSGDRGVSEGIVRGARPEATAGVRADSRRRDRLADLAGPVRVARAPRARGRARAPATWSGARRVTATLPADPFEERLAAYLFERSEESRAVRVGEKEVSEQAAIVERYASCSRGLSSRRCATAEDAAADEARERLTRLRLTCEDGIAVRELAERDDALENALLAARVPWQGEELPLRTAQARLATTGSYEDRDALGTAALAVSTGFNDERRSLLAAREELAADLTGLPTRSRGARPRRGSGCARCSTRSTRRVSRRPPPMRRRATAGSTACSARPGSRRRRLRTWPGCAGCRRSRTRTPASARCRYAWPRSARSVSTSRRRAESGSISTIARRSRPARA